MMKSIPLLLFFFLLGSVAFSQEQYEIDLFNLNYTIEKGVKNTTNSNIHIRVVYDDGSKETLYYRAIQNKGDRENGWQMEEPLQTFKRPVRIDAYAFVNFRTGTDADRTIPIPFDPPCVSPNASFSGNYSPRMTSIDFNYSIKPLIEVETPTYQIIGYEDFLTLNATPGFDNDLYGWQYATSYVTPYPHLPNYRVYNWQDVPVAGNSSISFTPEDFIAPTHIGNPIYFRVRSCYSTYTSNIVSHTLRPSAPKIVSTTTTAVSCFDAIDGTASITFNRPLDANDNLSLSIVDMSIPIGGVDENGRPNYQAVPIQGGNNVTLDAQNTITLTGVPPSTTKYRIDIIGSYNGMMYYTGGIDHTSEITIERPEPVAFATLPEDGLTHVYCYGGDDGTITFTAQGGVGAYQYLIREVSEPWSANWTAFSDANTNTISGKSQGVYQIKIRDANGCLAKQQLTNEYGETVLGEEIIKEVTISGPQAPLVIDFDADASKNPTAYGLTDGSIVAKVSGGTPYNDGSYDFQWKDENDVVLTSTETLVVPAPDNGYLITLNNVPKGIYYLTVSDANYNYATYNTTCMVADAQYELVEPDPLTLTLTETHPISCNNANQYGDPDSDGILVAHATGGIALDPLANLGLPYYYTWKKQNPDGLWDTLSIKDSIAMNLDSGIYAVNITDANGIVLGNYQQNILVTAKDSTYFLEQPQLLSVSFTKEDVICNSGANAVAEVIIEGGTAPYEIAWSNGATTPVIDGLTAGKYTVFVTDSRGCRTTGTVGIIQPNGLQAIVTAQQPPTCHLGNDGFISLQTQGGTPPYTFQWETGQTTENITDLEAGTYTVQINDAAACVYYKEITLEEPDPVYIDFGEKNTICKGQSLNLDISIDDPGAFYLWESDNGFQSNDPIVSLTEAGIYTASILTSQGCIGFDTIAVNVSDAEIDADFLVLSQTFTGQEVTMVNVSYPQGDRTAWIIPDSPNIQVVEENNEQLVVLFTDTGSYDFTLRSYQGDCYQDYQKTIRVEQAVALPHVNSSLNPFIQEFMVYPNPTDGEFTVKIALAEPASISLRLFNFTDNRIEMEQRKDGLQEYLIPVSISAASGIYVLVLETPKEDKIQKIIIR